jgi:hypothetical protein
VGRNTLRGTPISTANFAVFKNIKITEGVTAQFQAQAYNIMNTQFRGVPDPVLDDVATGRFRTPTTTPMVAARLPATSSPTALGSGDCILA